MGEIEAQYRIEFGPWDVHGTPADVQDMDPLHSNLSYFATRLIDGIKIGFMFSTGNFLTPSMQSAPNQKTLFATNLSQIRVRDTGVESMEEMPPVMTAEPLHATGAVFFLKWNRVYHIQNAQNDSILIRVVPLFEEHVYDELSPITYHGGEPIDPFLNTDMGNALDSLLARLRVCAARGDTAAPDAGSGICGR
jgi:hypothetical protein